MRLARATRINFTSRSMRSLTASRTYVFKLATETRRVGSRSSFERKKKKKGTRRVSASLYRRRSFLFLFDVKQYERYARTSTGTHVMMSDANKPPRYRCAIRLRLLISTLVLEW